MDKHTVMRFSAIDTRTRKVTFFRRDFHLDLSDPCDMFVILQDIILEGIREGYERMKLESLEILVDEV